MSQQGSTCTVYGNLKRTISSASCSKVACEVRLKDIPGTYVVHNPFATLVLIESKQRLVPDTASESE